MLSVLGHFISIMVALEPGLKIVKILEDGNYGNTGCGVFKEGIQN